MNYQTYDIVLSACLKINKCRLEEIILNGRQGLFCFSNVDPDLLARFDSDELLVEPKEFNSAVRILTGAVRRRSEQDY